MRLSPPVTSDEALSMLRAQAVAAWGEDRLPEMEEILKGIAEAMATVSAFPVPDPVEPLFP